MNRLVVVHEIRHESASVRVLDHQARRPIGHLRILDDLTLLITHDERHVFGVVIVNTRVGDHVALELLAISGPVCQIVRSVRNVRIHRVGVVCHCGQLQLRIERAEERVVCDLLAIGQLERLYSLDLAELNVCVISTKLCPVMVSAEEDVLVAVSTQRIVGFDNLDTWIHQAVEIIKRLLLVAAAKRVEHRLVECRTRVVGNENRVNVCHAVKLFGALVHSRAIRRHRRLVEVINAASRATFDIEAVHDVGLHVFLHRLGLGRSDLFALDRCRRHRVTFDRQLVSLDVATNELRFRLNAI